MLHATTEVEAHSHAWWQVSFSSNGIARMTVDDASYTIPPSRALWVPPNVRHSITVIEEADLHTLYGIDTAFMQADHLARPTASPALGWDNCRVLELSDLLRLLILDLDTTPDTEGCSAPMASVLRREQLIAPLLYDELARASALPVGLPLPRDRRLRALCMALQADVTRHDSLEGWAAEVGASPRTVLRLFRQELGITYSQWRQQAVLAQALARLAKGQALARIADDLGYDSPSAFSAMFRKTYGAPPSVLARELLTGLPA